MSVLKFRIMYEEDDTVFRDIDIKPAHSLIDLEAVIHSSYDLPATGKGLFYMSNDNWQKGKNIYPSEQKESKEAKKAKAKMAPGTPAIVSYLNDPHQHFIYEYQGQQEFIFLIELLSVGGKEDFRTNYPVCVRSQGASPFKKEDASVHFTKHVVPIVQDDDDEVEVRSRAEEEEEEEVPAVVMEAEEDEDAEEAEAADDSDKHDLMEGDAMEEEDEGDSVDDDFAGGDDFNPEDFSEGGDDFDDEDMR